MSSAPEKNQQPIAGNVTLGDLHRHSVNYWTASTNSYIAGPDYYDRQEQALREMLQKIGRVKNALDCGCGDGRYTLAIKDHADHVKGTDIAPALLGRARHAAARRPDAAGFTFTSESLETMQTGETYELVACMGVTSTLIEDAAFLRALDILSATVQPGGWLVMKDTLSAVEPQLAIHGQYVAMYRNIGRYMAAFAARGFALTGEHILLQTPPLHRINKLMLMRLDSPA